MEITTSLKKRFCKDFNIPIQIYQEPYWTERLILFDEQFGTLNKWKQFCKDINNFENEQDYFSEYNKFKDRVINHIKNNPIWGEFNNFDTSKYEIPVYQYGRNSVFKEDNIGKTLISVDLTSGNFSSMRYFNQDLIDGKLGYMDFIEQFTNINTFKNSKYIRQVIFGALNPKRQVKIEHYMMNFIMEALRTYVDDKYIQSFMNDEIVFEYNEDVEKALNKKELTLTEFINYLGIVACDNGFDIHCEKYELQKIHGIDAYIQYKDFNIVDYKCMNAIYFPMILRRRKGLDILDSDLVFYHEKQPCKFLEIPKFKIGEKNGLYIL